MKKIILASASPRRQQLLKEILINFEIITSDIEEVFPEDMFVDDVAEYLAKLKAEVVQSKVGKEPVIIAADTIVTIDNEILGKPADAAEAFYMINKLSNRSHNVITGVAILTENATYTFSEKTTVYFKDLTDEEIQYYIENYQPYDKAGAYAIQEWIGMIGISRIEGDYFNVVGLPVYRIYKKIRELAIL